MWLREQARAELIEVLVRGCARAGVDASARSDLRLEDSRILDNGGFGVCARDSASVEISGSTVTGNALGQIQQVGAARLVQNA